MLDLTKGPITKSMLLFAGPMILGNLLQQLYNIADTLIVGQFLGPGPLAAVGSSFTLMTFLTSIILGLCMGSGVVFSMLFGAGETGRLKNSLFISFVLIGAAAIVIEILSLALLSPLLTVLQVPADIRAETGAYLQVIFLGIFFTFIYNYFACVLRAIGNSAVPLIFLAISSVLNIVLDLVFIIVFEMGVAGAAWATIIAQGVSAGSIMVYCLLRVPQIRPQKQHLHFERTAAWNIARYSFLTCIQQSVMNFGILMIQGLVNSFGVSVMAAFAAAVKIDSFAYMPVQDFGNAFSTFIAQNYGAGKQERIRGGIRSAVFCALAFCAVVSLIVCLFARPLMLIFVKPEETQIIAIGMQYLRIEGACYAGIGCLFLLYGLFRGIGRPAVSIILTGVSRGTRGGLAYLLAPIPAFGLPAIWWAIPIGWFLADFAGLLLYRKAPRQKGRLSKQTV